MKAEKVFIVGCARTGSTLLRMILNRSTSVCITPETHFLRRVSRVGKLKQILQFGDLSDDLRLQRLVDHLYRPDPGWSIGYWEWLRNNVPRQELFERIARSDRTEKSIFLSLMEIYAENKGRRGALLGEKTPMHLYYVPTLMSWFPGAKVIHTFRDLRGIFVSGLAKVKSGKWGLKAKYPALPSWLVDPFLDPLELHLTTKVWKDAARLHQELSRSMADQYMLQQFEDLVSEPETCVRKVCQFLEVDYDPSMISDMVVVGSSYHEEKRKAGGFETQAIDRWKSVIHPLARTWISLVAGRRLKQFGYTP